MINFKSIKNGHWPIFLISLISATTNLFLPIILVRILEPSGMGVYKIFFLYAQSIIFISLSGAPLYSVYYWIGKKQEADIYVENAWILSLGLGLSTAVIGLILLIPLSQFISLTLNQTVLLLLSAVSSAPGAFYGEYLIAKGKRLNGSLFNTCFEVLKAILIINLVYFTKNINIAFLGFVILFFLKLMLATFLSKKAGIISLKIDFLKIKEVWKYCAPLSLAGALGFILEKIDMILLSSRISSENFAFYSMGCLIVPPLYILEMSVQKVLIPELSKSYHDENSEQMLHHYKKAQSDIAYLVIPAVFGLIIFSRPIIEILFTKKFILSADYLKIYAVTYLAYIIPHDAIPRATGKTSWILKMYLLLTPLSIIVVYLCAGLWSVKGALISSMVFFFIPKIPGLIFSSKILNFKVLKLIAWKPIALFISLNVIIASLVLLLKSMFINERNWFLFIAPFYAGLYLLTINIIKNAKGSYEILKQ